jgi:hypothetical protein
MLIQQIDPTVMAAIIGLIGAILSVGLPYVFTRNKEIDLSVRQEKTQRYDELIASLIDFTGDVERIEQDSAYVWNFNTLTKFIKAYHRSSTFASDDVLEKCNELVNLLMGEPEKSDMKETKEGTGTEGIKTHIVNIYKAIRLDINPKAKYLGIAIMWPTEEGSKEEVS